MRDARSYQQEKAKAWKASGRFWNEFWMTLEMHRMLLISLVILHVFVFSVLMYFLTDWMSVKRAFYYVAAKVCLLANAPYIKLGGYYPATLVKYLEGAARTEMIKAVAAFISSTPVYLLYLPAVNYFRKKGDEESEEVWLDGAKLITPSEMTKNLKDDGKKFRLPLGPELRLPTDLEPYHMLVCGQLGVGKTVFADAIVEELKRQKLRAIIHDFKGDYVQKHYTENTGLIVNPIDSRYMGQHGGWSLFNEVSTRMCIDSVASSLIPRGEGRDAFFNAGAQDIFIGILHHLSQTGKTTNRDLWSTIAAPPEEISKILKETKGGERGYAYLSNPTTPMAQSVLAVMMQFVKCFEYMQDTDGDFSFKRWVSNPEAKENMIFVSNYESIRETLRPILSLFMDLTAGKLLDLEEDRNRRLFFILDEFAALQRLPSFEGLLTRGRSFGGCAFTFIQTIAQLRSTYGPNDSETIIDNLANKVTFRVGSPETQKYMSQMIGDTKYVRTEESISVRRNDSDGATQTSREVTEPLVMPSRIGNLKNLECFITIPGYFTTQTKLRPKNYDQSKFSEKFSMRSGFSLEQIKEEQGEILSKAETLKDLVIEELKKDEKTIKKSLGFTDELIEREVEETLFSEREQERESEVFDQIIEEDFSRF